MLESLAVSLPLGLSYFSYAVYSSITGAVVGAAVQASHFWSLSKRPLQTLENLSTNPLEAIQSIDNLMFDDIKPKKIKYHKRSKDAERTQLEAAEGATG